MANATTPQIRLAITGHLNSRIINQRHFNNNNTENTGFDEDSTHYTKKYLSQECGHWSTSQTLKGTEHSHMEDVTRHDLAQRQDPHVWCLNNKAPATTQTSAKAS